MTTLDDNTAILILKTMAQGRLQSATPEHWSDRGLRAALSTTFDPLPAGTSEGDLARAALDLLSQDPEFAVPIETMVGQAASAPAFGQRYLDAGTISLVSAAVLALQTRIKLKRDNTGKWSVEIEKKASGDGAIKLLAERLLSFLPK